MRNKAKSPVTISHTYLLHMLCLHRYTTYMYTRLGPFLTTAFTLFTKTRFFLEKHTTSRGAPPAYSSKSFVIIYVVADGIISFFYGWIIIHCIHAPYLRHTEWSQRKTNIIWYHLHMESNKKWYRTYLKDRNKLTDFETDLMVSIGETIGGRGNLGGWE